MVSNIDVSLSSKKQNVAFGTSGVRGLVKDLTSELCFAYASSFLMNICSNHNQVALGIDLRPSSPEIAKSCALAAESLGVEVIFCGKLPTPALALFAMQMEIPAIMVTGSHIPFDRNGIKFYKAEGEITKFDETLIMNETVPLPDNFKAKLSCFDLQVSDLRAIRLFEKRYKDLFPPQMLVGKRIGVYEHSSVARDFLKEILKDFGAEVVSLERTDTFVPIDTEAVSVNDQMKALSWSKRYDLDAIVSTDGDGDRPLIADENGEWFRGDILGILCSNFLKATHVVAPINVNSALELSNSTRLCVRTKIGSPYVIEGINNLLTSDLSLRVVGYEANGGFFIGNSFSLNGTILSSLPTRDSILPILIILAMSSKNRISLSDLRSNLPPRYTFSDRVENFLPELSSSFIKSLKESKRQQIIFFEKIFGQSESVSVVKMDDTDGLRMNLTSGDIVHLRASGNAPELRCYVETNSVTRSSDLIKKIIEYLEKVPS